MYCTVYLILYFLSPVLFPGEAYEITVHFYSEHAGFFEQLLVFKFETQQPSSDKFEIMRLLEVTHRAPLSEESLPESSSDTQTEDSTPGARYGKLISCKMHVSVLIILYCITQLRSSSTVILGMFRNNYECNRCFLCSGSPLTVPIYLEHY